MCPAATSTAIRPESGSTGHGGFPSPTEGRSRPSRTRNHLRKLVLVATAALVAGWLAHALGFSEAFDAHLRRAYYAVRGVRSEPAQVVMLTFDEKTIEAWGPPPWSSARMADLLIHVARAKPRLVIAADPGPPLDAAFPSATQLGDRMIGPTLPAGQPIELEALGAPGLVEALPLARAGRGNEATITGRALLALKLVREGSVLPVNYFGQPMPGIEAEQLIRGRLGQRALEDRVVVIAPGSPRDLARVMTPRGEMAAVEVFANGLQGALAEKDWRHLPAAVPPVLSLVLGLIVAGLGMALSSSRMVALIAGLCALTLATDYALFASGYLLLGSATPLFALFAAGGCTALFERARVNNELSELKQTIAARFGTEVGRASPLQSGNEDRLWERVAESVSQYIPVSSMVVGWVPEDAWHVEFETHHNALPEDIAERRRDIRRLPYRPACQDQIPTWSERQFMKPERGEKSLVVPLIAFGRVIGLWMINVPTTTTVSGPHLEFIRLIATELANTHRRKQVAHIQTGGDVAGDGHMVTQIQDTRDAALSIARDQDSLLSLLDALPVGGLVATLLGEIRFCNRAMLRFLRSFDDLEGDPTRLPLARILARITGGNETVVQELLRELVVTKRTAKLSGDAGHRSGTAPGFELLISVYEAAREGGSTQPAGVVVAVSRAELPREELVDWSHRVGETGASQEKRIDLKKLLQKISVDPAVGATRPILMEIPKTVPRVRVAAGFSAAFRGLVGHATQLDGRGAITLTVKVTREEVQIILNAPDCSAALDAAATARTRAVVEAGWGRFVVQNSQPNQLEVHVDLPIAD